MEIKKQIYLIISIFFLLALFLAIFFVYPLSNEIIQKSNELISHKNSGLILESQSNEATNFKQKYDIYKTNLDQIDALFADSQNPVSFIEFLEEKSSGLGIKLQISTPSFSREGALAFENFRLSSSGSFSNTLKFVRELEAGPYLVEIQNLNISKSKKIDKSADSGSIGADFLIKVFSR
jgi:hypothetical protein